MVSFKMFSCARRLASSTESPICRTTPPRISASVANESSSFLPVCCSSRCFSSTFLGSERATAVTSLPETTPLFSSSMAPKSSAISGRKTRRSLSARRSAKLATILFRPISWMICPRTFFFSSTLKTGLWKNRMASGEPANASASPDTCAP